MSRNEVVLSLDVSAVPARPGGAGRFVVELARELVGRDDAYVTLISRRDDGRRWSELAAGRAARVLPVVPPPRPLRLAYEQARLGPLLGRLGPPAVAVHHAPHYTMPARCAVPCVVTIHDLTLVEHPEWHERSKVAFFGRAIRYAARHAALMVCVSEATRQSLVRHIAPRCPVAVVPHGVDLGHFSPDAPAGDVEKDEARLSAVGLRAGTPYLAYLGTLEPRKGVDLLVAAFDRLAASDPEIELVLAGAPGWHADAIDQAVGTARHRDRIRRLGYLEESAVPALLRRARAVVYPSREEGFGLPALEALACGATVVTTSGSAMSKVTGEAAWLAPPGDAAGLAEVVAGALSASGTERARRREEGLAVAAAHSWAAAGEAYMAAYRSVAR